VILPVPPGLEGASGGPAASRLEYFRGRWLTPHVRAFLFAALACAWTRLDAAPTTFSSGPYRVALVELYTSEGCSSCPPADEWLGKLRDNPGLWKEIVPVQFHVNYWDNLGWKDRLSTPSFTAREYSYASAWGSRNVYTPCFVRNGVEWKPSWGIVGGLTAPMGILSVEIGYDGECRVEFRPGSSAPASPDGQYEVHVALLGGGLASKVTAGENSGETLEHEFVALGVADQVLARDGGAAVFRSSFPLPRPIAAAQVRRALAAWVTPHGEMEPIQATGGWLP
jgi:hypothetical protein